MIDSPGYQYGKNTIAFFDRGLDNPAIIRRPGNNGDTILKILEFVYAPFPANANYLVAPVKRVLYHVPTQLPGSPHNTNFLQLHLFISQFPIEKRRDLWRWTALGDGPTPRLTR
jgi:hypothetical protein